MLMMIINKVQVQTSKITNIDNIDPCFTRGKFYVAYSLIILANNLNILYAHNQKSRKHSTPK